jgi:hypothetical protein
MRSHDKIKLTSPKLIQPIESRLSLSPNRIRISTVSASTASTTDVLSQKWNEVRAGRANIFGLTRVNKLYPPHFFPQSLQTASWMTPETNPPTVIGTPIGRNPLASTPKPKPVNHQLPIAQYLHHGLSGGAGGCPGGPGGGPPDGGPPSGGPGGAGVQTYPIGHPGGGLGLRLRRLIPKGSTKSIGSFPTYA